MKHWALMVIVLLAVPFAVQFPAPLAAQEVAIDTTTPEGAMLQEIGTTEDPAQKQALREAFTAKYPDHSATPGVWAQLSASYAEAGDTDKAFTACDKVLELKPTDSATAHSCLKIAEGLSDSDRIREWAVKTHAAAKAAVDAPMPDFEFVDQEAAWKEGKEFARQVGQYAEYSLYAAALAAADPAQKIELQNALAKLNPESEYLAQLQPQMFAALQQAGDTAGAAALAEKILETNPGYEDMLLFLADYHMRTTKDQAKSLEYARQLITLMDTKPAPEGISAEQWAAKKTKSQGFAHYMIGITASNAGKLAEADRELRAALPATAGNNNMRAEVLFHLGLANYKLGDSSANQQRILDAVNFTKQCAAIASPFQAQARKNLAAIQAQYRIQ